MNKVIKRDRSSKEIDEEERKPKKKLKTKQESTIIISEAMQNDFIDSIITNKDFGIVSKILKIQENSHLSKNHVIEYLYSKGFQDIAELLWVPAKIKTMRPPP
jgi:predicted type IV restriction endonuclease